MSTLQPEPLEQFQHILKAALDAGASDIHVKSGAPLTFRINGNLTRVEYPPPTDEWVSTVIDGISTPAVRARIERDHEADFSYDCPAAGRFRVNVFQQRGHLVCVLRLVKTQILTVEQLNLPASLNGLAETPQGLILLAGATGSGKSTTLAAMVDHINSTQSRHIITLEDPIEYVFEDKASLIEQREVGIDTASFGTALKNVLRQDPDVIVIGEMRDAGSFSAAIRAANTGHLVLSTLHTTTAAQSLNRILEFFNPQEYEQVRRQIAGALTAVVCQRLVASLDGRQLPAVEILINTPTVRQLIETNRLETLNDAIETGGEVGMQSFNQCLLRMVDARKISKDEALANATNPEALRMNLQGIFIDGSQKRILNPGRR